MVMYCAELRGNYRACNCLQVKFTFVWKPSIYAAESAISWKVNTTTFPDPIPLYKFGKMPQKFPGIFPKEIPQFLKISCEFPRNEWQEPVLEKFPRNSSSWDFPHFFYLGYLIIVFFSFYRGGGVLQSWVKKSFTFII